MNNWENLPNELLKLILSKVGYVGDCHWKYVNRQWSDMFYATTYSISITLGRSNKVMDNILHSPFQPGLWVKKVKMLMASIPANLSQIDPSTDLLHNFIIRCPNVHKFNMISADDQHWSYLSTVLLINCGWNKMTYLNPSFQIDDDLAYIGYLKCTFYFRKTLVSISLKQGTVTTENSESLRDHTALTTLKIMDGDILNNKTEKELLFRNLPSCFRILIINITQPMSRDDVNDFDNEIFSRVKELTITNFDIKSDHSFSQLIQEFPHVQKLELHGNPAFPLTEAVSKSAVKSFFKYIHYIPSVEVEFAVDNIALLLARYYDYHNAIISQGKFRISFEKVSTNDNNKMTIAIENNQTDIFICFKDNLDIWHLSNQVIQDVHFYGLKYWSFINVKGLLSSHQNLRHLSFQEGSFDTYGPGPKFQEFTIEHLEFQNISSFNENALQDISNDLPHLKRVDLGFTEYALANLVISVDYTPIVMRLPNTIVDLFQLTYSTYSSRSFFILAVSVESLKDHDETKYLVCDLESQYEIDFQRFISLECIWT